MDRNLVKFKHKPTTATASTLGPTTDYDQPTHSLVN